MSSVLAILICILAAGAVWAVLFTFIAYAVGYGMARDRYGYHNDFLPGYSWLYDRGYRHGGKVSKPKRSEINERKYRKGDG